MDVWNTVKSCISTAFQPCRDCGSKEGDVGLSVSLPWDWHVCLLREISQSLHYYVPAFFWQTSLTDLVSLLYYFQYDVYFSFRCFNPCCCRPNSFPLLVLSIAGFRVAMLKGSRVKKWNNSTGFSTWTWWSTAFPRRVEGRCGVYTHTRQPEEIV